MCGRFSLDTTKAEIAKEFRCDRVAFKGSSFNVAPSQNITAVINGGDNNEAVMMRWGLIPRWVKSLDSFRGNLINARVETADEKPSFKDAFFKRPCLIPVTGFYEWDKTKQPYYFHVEKGLFALAGIWETRISSETEEKLLSCTILTTQAKGNITDVHHRMPIVITPEYYDLWLDSVDERKKLIEALPEAKLKMYPVSKTVNSPKNNSPDCIEPTS